MNSILHAKTVVIYAALVAFYSLCSCSTSHFMGTQRYYKNSISLEFMDNRYEYYRYEGSIVLKEYSFGTWSYGPGKTILLKNNVRKVNDIPMEFSIHGSDKDFNIIFLDVVKGKFALKEDTTDYYNLEMYINGKKHSRVSSERSFITIDEKIEDVFFKLSLSDAANGFYTPVDTLISKQIKSTGGSDFHDYYINLDCEITQFFKVPLPNDTIKIIGPKKIYWKDKGLTLINE